jgi:hypothetical protein
MVTGVWATMSLRKPAGLLDLADVFTFARRLRIPLYDKLRPVFFERRPECIQQQCRQNAQLGKAA